MTTSHAASARIDTDIGGRPTHVGDSHAVEAIMKHRDTCLILCLATVASWTPVGDASADAVTNVTAASAGAMDAAMIMNGTAFAASADIGIADAGIGIADSGTGIADAGTGMANAGIGVADPDVGIDVTPDAGNDTGNPGGYGEPNGTAARPTDVTEVLTVAPLLPAAALAPEAIVLQAHPVTAWDAS